MRAGRGRLTPGGGYVVRVSQVKGGRPTVWVECLECVYGTAVPFANIDTKDPAAVGAAVLAAVKAWQAHDGREHGPDQQQRLELEG